MHRKILVLGFLVLPLAACGSLGEKSVSTPAAAATTAPNAVLPGPVPVQNTPKVVPTTRPATLRGKVSVSEFLQEMKLMGCTPKSAKYREVEGATTGGHIEITCTQSSDPLDLNSELR